MTRGRTRTDRRDLRVETLLQRTDATAPTTLVPEAVAMLQCCAEPRSVAEVAAALGLVLGVVTIVADDLITDGLLQVHHTDPVEIELDALTRMIERVRSI
jgi:hypothetical protein